MAAEGIDVAFRLGRLETHTLETHKLGSFWSILFASPDYLARRGQPQDLGDLAGHDCIIDTNRRTPRRWSFDAGAGETLVTLQGRFHVNSDHAAVELAVKDHGLAYAPIFALHEALPPGCWSRSCPPIRARPAPSERSTWKAASCRARSGP